MNWDGVGEDSVRAVEWYTKAAEQGETRAQFNLGCCYYCGIGVEKNLDKAIELFTRAAEQDYVTAQFTLGVCYENGCGVEKDMVNAVEWYTKAAERGFASAQFKLGRYYCEIAKDKNNAFFYFKQSADQGNEEAIVCLACCYECGAGTNKDCSLAFKLVREVAEKGYRRGQRVLGIYFIDGIGVDREWSGIKRLQNREMWLHNTTLVAAMRTGMAWKRTFSRLWSGLPRQQNRAKP